MGSSRLPGKVLMDLDGVPVLGFMLDRLSALAAHVVVATSDEAGDDPVASFAERSGVAVVRGSEADVLGRFSTALDVHPADVVVRLTADCPLIDAALIERVVERHCDSGADYTSNTLIRTHPDGLDVEVMSADALRAAAGDADEAAEREHVTPFIYRRPRTFRLAALREDERWGHLRWTLDTADDLERLRTMVAAGAAHRDWRANLGAAALLVDGVEPAAAAEVPGEAGPVDDPAAPVVVRRVAGAVVGWARLDISERGAATVTGSLDADDPALVTYVRSGLQVVGPLRRA